MLLMYHALMLLLLLQVVHRSFALDAERLAIAEFSTSQSSDIPKKSSKSASCVPIRKLSREEKGKAKINESPAGADSDKNESPEGNEADLEQQSQSLAFALYLAEAQIFEDHDMALKIAEQEVPEPPRDAALNREDYISEDDSLARTAHQLQLQALESFRHSNLRHHPSPEANRSPPARDEARYSQRRAGQPHENSGHVNGVTRRHGDRMANQHQPTREVSPRDNRAPPASRTEMGRVRTDSLREEDDRGVGLAGIPFVLAFYVALFFLAKLAVSFSRLFF